MRNDLVNTACNPRNSVVVEACAGSGKTWLLTARLFRLLLEGARPDQILAITFTRKAAQEMKERLLALLRECALVSDARLRELLLERGALDTVENMNKARLLAGDVLTSSKGLAIDTFHGWFASMCQMAPLSSGFSRQSEPTDQTEFWMDKAIDKFVQELLSDPQKNAELLSAFDTLASHMDRLVMRQVLKNALNNRVACMLWLRNTRAESLERVFDIDLTQEWPFEVFKNSTVIEQWWAAARWLALGTDKQKNSATRIEQTLTGLVNGDLLAVDAFEELRSLCLTDENQPAKSFANPTKAQKKAPDYVEAQYRGLFEELSRQMAQALQRQKDQLDMVATQALAKLTEPLFETYKIIKAEQGLCDFDDLEDTALRMLMDEQERAYMQQKLDLRIHHLLVDEFQDTNPVQWNILKLWLQDYTGSDKPSVFLVGDPKQSIYRFRRAEARLFNHARDWLIEHFEARVLKSDATRRCSNAVVAVLNNVFAPGQVQGLTPFRPHASQVQTDASSPLSGLVVYPKLSKPKLSKDNVGPDEAQHVVHTLGQWLKEGRIGALGEVMVLVRTHKSGLPLMAALREADLAYTIKDKGERYSSPVWSDTIAVLGFLKDPDSNLHLLQLLRCPLIGLSSEQFQALIQAEKIFQKGTVWGTVQQLAAQDMLSVWFKLHAQLSQWLAMARALPLFETLCKVVEETQASVKYLNSASARQRIMMAEHWDWLKGWALSLNKGRFPNLQTAFDEAVKLQAYASSDSEGASSNANVLRIMTVHSAKGLEANHVWLFDANSSPKPPGSNPSLLIDWPLGESHPNSVTVISSLSNPSPGRAVVQGIEQQAHVDEEDHLLYVALTRARHCVHLSGTEKRGGNKGWYERLLPHASHVLEQWSTHAVAAPVGHTESMNLFDRSAVWVRPQFPVLHALQNPVGKVLPCPDSPQLRMGIAWHAAMEHVDGLAAKSFEVWWEWVQIRCEMVFIPLNHSELQLVKEACEVLLNKAELRPWLREAEKAHNELEWVLGDGRSVRADRVVELPDRFVVLDYKWLVNELNLASYTQQVLEYVELVDQTLNQHAKPLPTQAALIDRWGRVYWLTSV